MPNFDYMCFECKCLYEIHVTLDSLDKEIKCPECEKALTRMISAPVFSIK
jgi:putative FmdB family regulatory protein